MCPRASSPKDEVALTLADAMIGAGKPVFGICRGMQEINVLFGGTLSGEKCCGRHLRGGWDQSDYAALFDHRHDVRLTDGGVLAQATGARRLKREGAYEGVDYYVNRDSDQPYDTIFVPVYPGYWLPFVSERQRTDGG